MSGFPCRKNRNEKIINNPDMPQIDSKELDKMPFVSEVYQKHLKI